MANKRWRIEGYNGTDKVMQDTIGFGSTTQEQIIVTLQRLCSKHLADHEIVAASLPPKAPGYSSALEAQIDTSNGLTISVGSNPHFVARLLEND